MVEFELEGLKIKIQPSKTIFQIKFLFFVIKFQNYFCEKNTGEKPDGGGASVRIRHFFFTVQTRRWCECPNSSNFFTVKIIRKQELTIWFSSLKSSESQSYAELDLSDHYKNVIN
jgi:hypothetical protein